MEEILSAVGRSASIDQGPRPRQRALSLLELLKGDAEVTAALPAEKIAECFDLGYHFRQVDVIFERVFGRSN